MSDTVDTRHLSGANQLPSLTSARAWSSPDRLSLLVLIAYVLGVAFLFLRHQALLANNEFDSVYYLLGAQDLSAFDDRFHGPGYPAAIWLAQLLVGSEFAAAKLVTALSATGVAVLIWLWARRASGAWAGLVALTFWAANADALIYSVLAVSDMLALVLLGLTLTTLASTSSRWWVMAPLAGGFANATYLSRYVNGYVAVLVGVLYLAWFMPVERRSRLIASILFLAAFVLVGLPWFLKMTTLHGNPFWNENHLNIAFKAYADRQWGSFPTAVQFPNVLSVIAYSPLTFVKSWWGTLYELPTYLAGRFAWAGLFFLPGTIALIKRTNRATGLALLAAAIYAPLVALTWLEPRLLLPLYPLVCVSLGKIMTASWLPDRLTITEGNRRWTTWLAKIPLRWLIALILLGSLLYRLSWQLDVWFADEAREYQQAGLILREETPPDAGILTAAPHIALYSQRPIFTFGDWLENVSAETLEERLNEIPAAYLAFDARFGATQFSHLDFLLTPDSDLLPPNLLWLHTVSGSHPVVIYQIVKGGDG